MSFLIFIFEISDPDDAPISATEDTYKKAMARFCVLSNDVCACSSYSALSYEHCSIPASAGSKAYAFFEELSKSFIVDRKTSIFYGAIRLELKGVPTVKRKGPSHVQVLVEEMHTTDTKKQRCVKPRYSKHFMTRSNFEKLLLAVMIMRDWRDLVVSMEEVPDIVLTAAARAGVSVSSLFPFLKIPFDLDASMTMLELSVCVLRYNTACAEIDSLRALISKEEPAVKAPKSGDHCGDFGSGGSGSAASEDVFSAQSDVDWVYQDSSRLVCIPPAEGLGLGSDCRVNVHPYTLSAACLCVVVAWSRPNCTSRPASSKDGNWQKRSILGNYLVVKTLLELGPVPPEPLKMLLNDSPLFFADEQTSLEVKCACVALMYVASRAPTTAARTAERVPQFFKDFASFFAGVADALDAMSLTHQKTEASVRLVQATHPNAGLALSSSLCATPLAGGKPPAWLSGHPFWMNDSQNWQVFSVARASVSPISAVTSLEYLERKMCLPGLRSESVVLFDNATTYVAVPRHLSWILTECVTPHLLTYPCCRVPYTLQIYPILLRNYMSGNPIAVAHSMNTLLRLYHCSTGNTLGRRRVPLHEPERCLARYSCLSRICERFTDSNELFATVQEVYRIDECEREDTKYNDKAELVGRRSPTFKSDMARALKAFVEVDVDHYISEKALGSLAGFVRSAHFAGPSPTALEMRAVSFCSEHPYLEVFVTKMLEHARSVDSKRTKSKPSCCRVNIPPNIIDGTGWVDRPEDLVYMMCADVRVPDSLAVELFLSVSSKGPLRFTRRLNRDHEKKTTVEQLSHLWCKWTGYVGVALGCEKTRTPLPVEMPISIPQDTPTEGLRLLMMFVEELSFFEVKLRKSELRSKGRDVHQNMVEDSEKPLKDTYRGCVKQGGMFLDLSGREIMSLAAGSMPISWMPQDKEPKFASDYFPSCHPELATSDTVNISVGNRKFEVKNPFSGSVPDILDVLVLYPIKNICTNNIQNLLQIINYVTYCFGFFLFGSKRKTDCKPEQLFFHFLVLANRDRSVIQLSILRF